MILVTAFLFFAATTFLTTILDFFGLGILMPNPNMQAAKKDRQHPKGKSSSNQVSTVRRGRVPPCSDAEYDEREDKQNSSEHRAPQVNTMPFLSFALYKTTQENVL